MWSVCFLVWPNERNSFNEISLYDILVTFSWEKYENWWVKDRSEDHYKIVREWLETSLGSQQQPEEQDGHRQDREGAEGGDEGSEGPAGPQEHSSASQTPGGGGTREEAVQWRRQEERGQQGGPQQADQPEAPHGAVTQQVPHRPQTRDSDRRHGFLRQTDIQQRLLWEPPEVFYLTSCTRPDTKCLDTSVAGAGTRCPARTWLINTPQRGSPVSVSPAPSPASTASPAATCWTRTGVRGRSSALSRDPSLTPGSQRRKVPMSRYWPCPRRYELF